MKDNHKILVGCCMVILNPSGDKVLVAKRKKEPDADGWQIPGGIVDYGDGENPREAIVREVSEEVGIGVDNPEFLCVISSFYNKAATPADFAFVGTASSEKLPPNPEPHKHDDWQWVSLAALPEGKWFHLSRLAVDFHKKLQADPSAIRFVVDSE